MLADFLMLGLKMGATDAQIRKRYLELIKTYSPEKHPKRFQDITYSYERIRDQRSRIRTQIFGYRRTSDVEATLRHLAGSIRPSPKRIGLKSLLAALSAAPKVGESG